MTPVRVTRSRTHVTYLLLTLSRCDAAGGARAPVNWDVSGQGSDGAWGQTAAPERVGRERDRLSGGRHADSERIGRPLVLGKGLVLLALLRTSIGTFASNSLCLRLFYCLTLPTP
jgi:hypothetical protein